MPRVWAISMRNEENSWKSCLTSGFGIVERTFLCHLCPYVGQITTWWVANAVSFCQIQRLYLHVLGLFPDRFHVSFSSHPLWLPSLPRSILANRFSLAAVLPKDPEHLQHPATVENSEHPMQIQNQFSGFSSVGMVVSGEPGFPAR